MEQLHTHKHSHDHECDGHVCNHGFTTVATQSLEELNFQRGLWTAALNGDDSRIQMLLGRGHNPNLLDDSGYTPLHYACRSGKLSSCKLLVEKGANVNAKVITFYPTSKLTVSQTKAGATPLHRAGIFALRRFIHGTNNKSVLWSR